MFSGALHELVKLSELSRIPQEIRRKAKEGIRELYSKGFSYSEIEYLVGGRWKRSTIKKYCLGVEVKDTAEKDMVLDVLREYVKSEGDWEEIEYYVDTKRKLDKRFSLEQIIEFKEDFDRHDLEPEEVAPLISYMNEKDIKFSHVLNQLKDLSDLYGLGYTPADLEYLYKNTIKYGGIEEFTRNFMRSINAKEFQIVVEEAKEEVDKWNALSDEQRLELKRLDVEAMSMQSYIDITQTLVTGYGFDLNAFNTLLTAAMKYGRLMDVLDAVNKYGSMREIEAARAQANEALKQTLREMDEAQAMLAPAREAVDELNRRIGAIQEKHRTSRTLMNVASLLEYPTTANLEPQEFMVLALALLNTLKQYAYVHRGSLGSWNAWVNPDVNSAATNLNNIIVGKLS